MAKKAKPVHKTSPVKQHPKRSDAWSGFELAAKALRYTPTVIRLLASLTHGAPLSAAASIPEVASLLSSFGGGWKEGAELLLSIGQKVASGAQSLWSVLSPFGKDHKLIRGDPLRALRLGHQSLRQSKMPKAPPARKREPQTVGLGVLAKARHSRYSLTSNGESASARGLDFMAALGTTSSDFSAGDVLYTLDLYPSNFVGTRPAIEAQRWEKYAVKKFDVHYEPVCSTSTNGQIVVFCDPDPDDSIPATGGGINNLRIAEAHKGASETQVWAPTTAHYDVDPHMTDLFTDLGNTPDERFSSFGRLYVLASSAIASGTPLGNLKMEYDFEFRVPNVKGPSDVGLQPIGAAYSVTGNSAGPFSVSQTQLSGIQDTLSLGFTATNVYFPIYNGEYFLVGLFWGTNGTTVGTVQNIPTISATYALGGASTNTYVQDYIVAGNYAASVLLVKVTATGGITLTWPTNVLSGTGTGTLYISLMAQSQVPAERLKRWRHTCRLMSASSKVPKREGMAGLASPTSSAFSSASNLVQGDTTPPMLRMGNAMDSILNLVRPEDREREFETQLRILRAMALASAGKPPRPEDPPSNLALRQQGFQPVAFPDARCGPIVAGPAPVPVEQSPAAAIPSPWKPLQTVLPVDPNENYKGRLNEILQKASLRNAAYESQLIGRNESGSPIFRAVVILQDRDGGVFRVSSGGTALKAIAAQQDAAAQALHMRQVWDHDFNDALDDLMADAVAVADGRGSSNGSS